MAAEKFAHYGVERVDLKTLLELSDVVTLHCNLTSETRNLIGAEELRALRRTAVLINTARGAIVDLAALCDALDAGALAAAALDVLPEEPPAAAARILSYGDRVLLSPHMTAANQGGTLGAAIPWATEATLAALRGETPKYVYNDAALDKWRARFGGRSLLGAPGERRKRPMIHVQNLAKTFGDVKAVDGVSFDVHPREIFAFLGPNGAGKTTTIQMLTTLLRPTSGTIAVDGLDPVTRQLDVRRRFGIVFQDPSLDEELTAYENMDLHGVLYHVPRRTRAERIETLLKLFELWDRRTALVKTFSGGMRRRLEIARGFLHTPKILFLDEPTLGLDPQSRNQLWTHVRALNESEGVTVFLTTHYMDEAERVAHRVAIIDHGRIVAQGTVADLKQQTGTDSLEQAFLKLTGSTIRDERVDGTDQMRQMARMWQRNKR